ncbi:hypothetical protein MHBO_002050 [Bonamia ostreae]|uniref:Uncharacterized protein n=1 Tax=Bonamia ostreae TaxID=126728 RepID=A0ABV2AL24_9EUKA
MRCVSNLLRKFHMENDCPLKNKENFKVKITDIKAPSMSKDETNSLEWDKLKTISQPKSSSDAEEQSKLRKSEALKVLNETKKSLLWEEDDSPVLEENFEIQKRKNLEKDVQSEKVEKNSKEKEIVGKNVDSVE